MNTCKAHFVLLQGLLLLCQLVSKRCLPLVLRQLASLSAGQCLSHVSSVNLLFLLENFNSSAGRLWLRRLTLELNTQEVLCLVLNPAAYYLWDQLLLGSVSLCVEQGYCWHLWYNQDSAHCHIQHTFPCSSPQVCSRELSRRFLL